MTDREILLTTDGRGIQAKEEALNRLLAAILKPPNSYNDCDPSCEREPQLFFRDLPVDQVAMLYPENYEGTFEETLGETIVALDEYDPNWQKKYTLWINKTNGRIGVHRIGY